MDDQTGTLYVCATPIGNLGDVSERLIKTLDLVDLVAAEDTRNTLKLLNHIGVKKPLTSYHEHNKYDKAEELCGQLISGKNIALVSDAGMPAISDPGEILVARCHENGIKVSVIPGPCALVSALALSGLSTRRFCFEGFLPSAKEDKELRKRILDELENETRTIVMYEAPHRLVKTLETLHEILGERKIVLVREISKIHEEITISTFGDILNLFYAQKKEDLKPRGEYVIVIEGMESGRENENTVPDDDSVTERLKELIYSGIEKKEAIKTVSKETNRPKKEIYNLAINFKNSP